jgi:hypothetical protein
MVSGIDMEAPDISVTYPENHSLQAVFGCVLQV